ncbi:cell division protein FtsZ [Propionivibrio sp.]|uniref:cell division protein FtsZ n=1 Tax=Propionivibrio sp. TaxID=2212460 RepID=UPI003BF382DE
MKRRSFIRLAGVIAALWLPSIVSARQKSITGEVAATSSPIVPPHELQEREQHPEGEWHTVIKVIGVGGAGVKAIEYMIDKGLKGCEFVVADTDARALKRSSAKALIQLGQTCRGVGGNSEVGFNASMENRRCITECLKGAHMVFIVAGMGCSTGTGAAPLFAEVARELGTLTVGLVTTPSGFEGRLQNNFATGIAKLQTHSDSLILIHNDKLSDVLNDDASLLEIPIAAHTVMHETISGITEMILIQGMVGVDFEDVRTVMGGMGVGMMGLAIATGSDRARIAAQKAIASPLLDGVDLAGAQGVLVCITAKRGFKMREVNEVMNTVRKAVAEDAHIIFGTSYDENMGDDIRVTLVATGYSGS